MSEIERRWRRPDGVVFRTNPETGRMQRQEAGLPGFGSTCFSLEEMAEYGYPETFDHLEPTEPLPPTTADLNTRLAAFEQFEAAITASFKDTAKRSHQLDFQAAYDRLHKSIKEPT